jgi:hypothetical protein
MSGPAIRARTASLERRFGLEQKKNKVLETARMPKPGEHQTREGTLDRKKVINDKILLRINRAKIQTNEEIGLRKNIVGRFMGPSRANQPGAVFQDYHGEGTARKTTDSAQPRQRREEFGFVGTKTPRKKKGPAKAEISKGVP